MYAYLWDIFWTSDNTRQFPLLHFASFHDNVSWDMTTSQISHVWSCYSGPRLSYCCIEPLQHRYTVQPIEQQSQAHRLLYAVRCVRSSRSISRGPHVQPGEGCRCNQRVLKHNSIHTLLQYVENISLCNITLENTYYLWMSGSNKMYIYVWHIGKWIKVATYEQCRPAAVVYIGLRLVKSLPNYTYILVFSNTNHLHGLADRT